MASTIQQFLREHGISEVEAIIPDMAGIARGKLMPAEKFAEEEGMRLPEAIFLQTVTGDYPEDQSAMNPSDIDIVLKADPKTVRVVPWAAEPTAQVIHDCFYGDGRPVTMAPRYVLRRMLDLYEAQGWEPVVAPELEFFLVEPNIDSDYPLKPPVGRSGRPEIGRQAYSIAAVNEFDPLFDDMYSFCEAQDIEIDTLIHEAGAAQMEINLLHGYPMGLADQAFLFKRTAREAAMRHKMYATFMAKPMAKEPGSAMHLHQSIIDSKTRKNIFSNPDGTPSELFFGHIAGLQKYLPGAMSLFCPNVNSYRRISRYSSAPINVHWGYDNRTAGLRVPMSGPEARRVENRVGGADANPYLAIAASLACGYLGMIEGLKPSEPIAGSAYDLAIALPRTLAEALRLLRESKPLVDLFGDRFVLAFTAVKEAEYETFAQVISSWEREHCCSMSSVWRGSTSGWRTCGCCAITRRRPEKKGKRLMLKRSSDGDSGAWVRVGVGRLRRRQDRPATPGRRKQGGAARSSISTFGRTTSAPTPCRTLRSSPASRCMLPTSTPMKRWRPSCSRATAASTSWCPRLPTSSGRSKRARTWPWTSPSCRT